MCDDVERCRSGVLCCRVDRSDVFCLAAGDAEIPSYSDCENGDSRVGKFVGSSKSVGRSP